jgi:hypothetical protein
VQALDVLLGAGSMAEQVVVIPMAGLPPAAMGPLLNPVIGALVELLSLAELFA